MFPGRSLSKKIFSQNLKNVISRTFSTNLMKLIVIYCLLKMSHSQVLLDLHQELINVKSLDFTQILDTKKTIEQHYNKLLGKHEEPFKTIAKTTTDVSLLTISASIDDFQDVIKALPQSTEITIPVRPKRFVAIGLAIAAMAMSSFNAYRITEHNSEISALKSKKDLLVDVSHLHEAYLHHLKEKMDATNRLLAGLLISNVWFTTKITDAVKKKFQSVVHHHENVVKSAQHQWQAPGHFPHDVLDEILNHTLSVARKRNMVSFINYALDLLQVEVSHLYDPKTLQFTLIMHIPLISNANLLKLYEFLTLPIHFNFSANVSVTP